MKIKDLKVDGKGIIYRMAINATLDLFPTDKELVAIDRYFNAKYGNRELNNFCYGFISENDKISESELSCLSLSIYYKFFNKWKGLKDTFDLDVMLSGDYSYDVKESVVDDGNVAGDNEGQSTFEHMTSGYDNEDYVSADKDVTTSEGRNAVKTDNFRERTLERTGFSNKQYLKTNNMYFLNKYSFYDIIFLDIIDEITYLI